MLHLRSSLFVFFLWLTACSNTDHPQPTTGPAVPATTPATNPFSANVVAGPVKNIISMFQDKKGYYWLGSSGSGVYRYDGSTLLQFTQRDGLSDNQVQTIQEDQSGHIWFGTGGFGVTRFDGQTFTNFTDKAHLQADIGLERTWKSTPGDLWFNAGGGVYRYDGAALTYLPLPATDTDQQYKSYPAQQLSPYAVYSILKDKKGNLWMGTQTMGVCRFDPAATPASGGKAFTWLTDKGLKGPAVLALFEDKNGHLWFGNNGNGLFRFDPSAGTSSLTNFTREKGLNNDDFVKKGKSDPGSLARIYAVNEDTNGDLWIGTVDAGAWRYDGTKLTQYTTRDGLPANVVSTLYKDKKGDLWLATTAGICMFNGESFVPLIP